MERFEASFRTFPKGGEEFTFSVCGDSQDPRVFKPAAGGFMQWNPRFVIHAGDMVDNGRAHYGELPIVTRWWGTRPTVPVAMLTPAALTWARHSADHFCWAPGWA